MLATRLFIAPPGTRMLAIATSPLRLPRTVDEAEVPEVEVVVAGATYWVNCTACTSSTGAPRVVGDAVVSVCTSLAFRPVISVTVATDVVWVWSGFWVFKDVLSRI